MNSLLPLFAASYALLAEATDTSHLRANSSPSSDAIFHHNEVSTSGRSALLQAPGGEWTKLPLFALAPLAATAAMIFLIIACVTAIRTNGKSSINFVQYRSLAEGASGSCIVGFCKQ